MDKEGGEDRIEERRKNRVNMHGEGVCKHTIFQQCTEHPYPPYQTPTAGQHAVAVAGLKPTTFQL